MLLVFVTHVAQQDEIICTPSCPPRPSPAANARSVPNARAWNSCLANLLGPVTVIPIAFNMQCLDFSAVLAVHWFTGLRRLSRRSNRKGPVGSDPPSPPTIKRMMLSSHVSNIIIATWDGPIANRKRRVYLCSWVIQHSHLNTFGQTVGDTKIYDSLEYSLRIFDLQWYSTLTPACPKEYRPNLWALAPRQNRRQTKHPASSCVFSGRPQIALQAQTLAHGRSASHSGRLQLVRRPLKGVTVWPYLGYDAIRQ